MTRFVQTIPEDARGLIEQFVQRLASGKIDRATARCDLGLSLRRAGHWELADFDWLDIVLTLNSALRCCWRQYQDGSHAAILDQWPAEELIQVGPAQEPVDWPSRWCAAGGQLFSGRMIALKDSRVWRGISDFGYPFPPFAATSKMRVRAIDRDIAMSLGLIDRDRRVHIDHFPLPQLYLDVELPEET
jgi:hypothetical protein